MFGSPAIGRAVIGAALSVLCAAPAPGQQQLATLTGRVTDRASGLPVPRAEIIHQADSRSVISDSLGVYVFTALPSGQASFVVRAIGYPAQTHQVLLVANQRLVLDVRMGDSAQALPTVDVTARNRINPRLVDFERRRKTGRGQYMDEEQLKQTPASALVDVLKTMRGLVYHCVGVDCYVHMSRAPRRCLPEYIIDSRPDNTFGPRTPIRDIVGLEVYSGPADVPGEFAGSNAGCGVIVVWTKSGPSP